MAPVGLVQERAARIGDRVGAHSPRACGGECLQLGQQAPAFVEQIGGVIAAHPVGELRELRRIVQRIGQGDLVRTPEAFDLQAVECLGSGPPLRAAQHDEGPAGHGITAAGSGILADRSDAVERPVQRMRHARVHRLVLLARDDQRIIAKARDEGVQLIVGHAAEDGGIGDLVAVQVKDRQHRAVRRRIEEGGAVPPSGERPGLRLAVPHHAGGDQIGLVEHRAKGVAERIAKLSALVDRSGNVRAGVAGDAAGEGELAEQPRHAGFVFADLRVRLGPGALEPAVGNERRAAVPGAADEQHVGVALPDHAVEVRPDEVQPRAGAPMAEQAQLDVLGRQRLAQHGVGAKVDLADGEVIGGAPIAFDRVPLARFAFWTGGGIIGCRSVGEGATLFWRRDGSRHVSPFRCLALRGVGEGRHAGFYAGAAGHVGVRRAVGLSWRRIW